MACKRDEEISIKEKEQIKKEMKKEQLTKALVLNEDPTNPFEEGNIGATELNDESASRVGSSTTFASDNVDQDVRNASYGKGKQATRSSTRFDDCVMGL